MWNVEIKKGTQKGIEGVEEVWRWGEGYRVCKKEIHIFHISNYVKGKEKRKIGVGKLRQERQKERGKYERSLIGIGKRGKG